MNKLLFLCFLLPFIIAESPPQVDLCKELNCGTAEALDACQNLNCPILLDQQKPLILNSTAPNNQVTNNPSNYFWPPYFPSVPYPWDYPVYPGGGYPDHGFYPDYHYPTYPVYPTYPFY